MSLELRHDDFHGGALFARLRRDLRERLAHDFAYFFGRLLGRQVGEQDVALAFFFGSQILTLRLTVFRDLISALLDLAADDVQLVGVAQIFAGLRTLIGKTRKGRPQSVDPKLILGFHRIAQFALDAIF